MRIAPVVLVAFVVAGCGGNQDPKDPNAALEKMFHEFSDGAASGDWDKTCSRVTREYVYLSKVALRDAGAEPPNDCAGVMAFAAEHTPRLQAQLADEYEDARFDGAEVTGSTARVDYSVFLDGEFTTHERQAMTAYARRDDDGRWKITRITSA